MSRVQAPHAVFFFKLEIMLPAYIIHHKKQHDRKDLVQALVDLTGATIVEPVWIPNDPIRGCRESHKKVARLAKERNPEKAYLVFEDDCEIIDPNFLDVLKEHPDVDILYFGLTHYVDHTLPFPIRQSCGTHAMMMTPKARDIFFSKVDEYLNLPFPHDNHPVDQIFCVMEVKESLKVWKPHEKSVERYVRQKPGLFSTISKTMRKEKDEMLYISRNGESSYCQRLDPQQLQYDDNGNLKVPPMKDPDIKPSSKIMPAWQMHELRRSLINNIKVKGNS